MKAYWADFFTVVCIGSFFGVCLLTILWRYFG